MLDILRKQASSWITKVLLLLIIIVFIFFFGNTGRRGSSQQQGIVAEVNKEPITEDELTRLVQNQLDAYQQMYKDKLPEELVNQFRSLSLQSLIEDRLVRAEAKKMGLRVSDAEILKAIQDNPNLEVKGVFNPEQYKNVFRPWFLNHNGIDYEEFLRREKLKDKFHGLFVKSTIVSDNEAKNHYALDNTKLGLTVITLRAEDLIKDFKPSDKQIADRAAAKKSEPGNEKATDDFLKKEATREIKTTEGKKRVESALAEIWPSFSNGKTITSLLSKYGIKPRDVAPTALSQTTAIFPGEDDTDEAIRILLKLNRKKSFPDKPIQLGNSYYLVKLTERTDPDWTLFEKNKASEKTKIERELGEHFYDLWYQNALTKAKIKIHES